MLKAQTEALLNQLRAGAVEQAPVESLQKESAKALQNDLATRYPCLFQERRLRDKWERGVARKVSMEVHKFEIEDCPLPALVIVYVLRGCLFLSGEGDTITGIGMLGRLELRATNKPRPGLIVTSGKGYKLDQTIDGWSIKPLKRQTTRLANEFLQKRGWRFDALASLPPTNIRNRIS